MEYFDSSRVPWQNISIIPGCNQNELRDSCMLADSEYTKRSVVAIIRIVVSILGIGGSLSIIISAIVKKQVTSSKVLPIFVISIADCLLALTWVVGGVMWLGRIDKISYRDWCFFPSLLTVILVCISANLTLVYAIGAHQNIKKTNLNTILSHREKYKPCKPSMTIIMYLLACGIPIVLLLVTFGSLEAVFQITEKARICSCWCLPYFGNILPLAFPGDNETAEYLTDIRNLVALYGFVVGTNYLVVFVLLLIIYWKILRWIGWMRRERSKSITGHSEYGSMDMLLMRGQSQARKRVVFFLLVFIITGFSNVLLSYSFTGYEILRLTKGTHIETRRNIDHLSAFPMTMFVFQSLTTPLQGLLNAIVYGWTREEFFEAITHSRVNSDSQQKGRRYPYSRRSRVEIEESTNHTTDERKTNVSNVVVEHDSVDVFSSSPQLVSEETRINASLNRPRESGYGSCVYDGDIK